MDDLVTFLWSCLDEDERSARAAESAKWHAKERDGLGLRVVSISHEIGQVTASILSGNAEHIARHDPARVLAEVEAKRLLLTLHKECDPSCYIVRVLALPYADLPGYQEAWRP